MAGLLDVLPMQDKTFLGTLLGDRTPITALSPADQLKAAEVIKASRMYKQGLLDKYPNMTDEDIFTYRRIFPNQKAIDAFKSGTGNVGYDAYMDAGQGTSDFNFLPSGSIRNTLGQFRYVTDKDGNISIKEVYDFKNDKVEGLPSSIANSKRYENMSIPKKAFTVAKETFYMPDPNVGFNPLLGLDSLMSRLGNAFIGDKGRDVNIKFKPPISINPTEEERYKMLVNMAR